MKNAKRLYYSNAFYASKSDSSKTWKTINELLNPGKGQCVNLDIDEFIISNNNFEKNVSSASDIAEELNNYFVTIGPNLANEISDVPISFKQYLGEKNDKSLVWKPVTEEEVMDFLMFIRHDNLPARLLIDAASFICKPLTYIFNLKLETGTFPEALKVAKATVTL